MKVHVIVFLVGFFSLFVFYIEENVATKYSGQQKSLFICI